jgi:hypothetical protein
MFGLRLAHRQVKDIAQKEEEFELMTKLKSVSRNMRGQKADSGHLRPTFLAGFRNEQFSFSSFPSLHKHM